MVTLGLKPATAGAIDKQVEKVLRGLGNPKPPLDLKQVRDLLRLDEQFYSTSRDSFLREKISRIKVGTKLVLNDPMILLTAIKKLDLKALYIPERKVILLDETVPTLKLRWNEAHEVGHSLLDWHQEMMLGDDKITLNRDCHDCLENEANFAAGRLLFLRDRFTDECLSIQPSLANVKTLGKSFGNTITSTLWRTVESLASPAIGIVSGHPKYRSAEDGPPWKYFVRSPSFERQFSRISPEAVFEEVRGYCSYVRSGPLGAAEVAFHDDNGTRHIFAFETMHNSYDSLTLGVQLRAHAVIVGAV